MLSTGLALGQTTTNTYSATGTTTNPAYTSPVTTDSTNATGNTTYSATPSSLSTGSGMTTDGNTMNTAGTPAATTTNGTYSTNSAAPSTYGTTTTTTTDTYTTTDQKKVGKAAKDYKNFVFGVYAGLNSTRFKGEDVDGNNLSGRLGYQAGFFVRGGGRLYGQLGAEYFASSSNFYSEGDGTPASTIRDQINIQYVQIPLYIGFKLLESDRGISAIRLQAGVEYANRINSDSGDFNLSNSEVKSGTFNGLGQLGFDIGPLLIDLTYHHGFSDAIDANTSTGFAGSQRRIVSASVGFKF